MELLREICLALPTIPSLSSSLVWANVAISWFESSDTVPVSYSNIPTFPHHKFIFRKIYSISFDNSIKLMTKPLNITFQ